MKIPCETIVRFSNLIDPDHEKPAFRTLRLEKNMIIATDRLFMAVERLACDPISDVTHITLSPELIEQCRTESQFSGFLEVVVTPALNFATAKTSFGWNAPDNIGVFGPPNDFDRWHEVFRQSAEPAKAPQGAMMIDTEALSRLAAAAPSGKIIFETNIDVMRPAIVRDISSPDWCGCFYPRINDGKHYAPASLPGWLK